jgi:hypothetical protein
MIRTLLSENGEGVGREAWMRPVRNISAGKLFKSIVGVGGMWDDLETHFLCEAAIEQVQWTFVS